MTTMQLVFAAVTGGTKTAEIGHPMKDVTTGRRVRLAGEGVDCEDGERRFPVASNEDGSDLGLRTWDELRAW